MHDPPTSDAESPISHSSALPDFLSDTGGSRNRQPMENMVTEEPVRGPSFESKESLRLEIERLRMEVAEKNRR